MKINIDNHFISEVVFDNNIYNHIDTSRKYLVCIDSNVYNLHKRYLSNLLDSACLVIYIDALETNKSFGKLHEILNILVENNIERSTTLISIGGGIIGDLCGLVASLYMRGLPFIMIPTTLLAQVDSSIGGKVAVNDSSIKNIFGTFYHPKLVIISTNFLETLTTRAFKSGLVELIKHGIICDENLFSRINSFNSIFEIKRSDELLSLIKDSLAVKKTLVEIDPLDKNERNLLNFGHTFAHALELSSTYFHGECVAIGILVSLYSTNLNVFNSVKLLFEKLELIRPLIDFDFSKVIYDKKQTNSIISEVIIDNIGNSRLIKLPTTKLIDSYYESYQLLKNSSLKTIDSVFVFEKSSLNGTVNIPPSKSYLHRYIIASALSMQDSILENVSELSNDVLVTLDALQFFNKSYKFTKNKLHIYSNQVNFPAVFNFKESATSYRLLLPLLLKYTSGVKFIGENNLPNRPMQVYQNLYECNNIYATYLSDKNLPVIFEGEFKPGNYVLDGSISSQFISGLLFLLPLLNNKSTIAITNKLESLPYVLMTLDVLNQFDIKVDYNNDYSYFEIFPNQVFHSKKSYFIEQDYSSRSVFEVAKYFHSGINILPETNFSIQSDVIINQIINNQISEVDLVDCPDLAPILAIYFSKTGGVLKNTYRLKYKESNRLEAIIDMLNSFGVSYSIKNDDLIINKCLNFNGGSFNTHNDHRITMAIIIGASLCQDKVYIKEVNSIDKSFKSFLSNYVKLGGMFDEE